MIEQWKRLGRYEVSSLGRVRNRKTGRILKPFTTKPGPSGYFLVRLYQPSGVMDCLVHRLVAEVFQVPGHGTQLNHKNLNKKDNTPQNLEWVSASENALHARRNRPEWGPKGSNVKSSKLTEAKVRDIRKRCAAGATQQSMADKYNISQVAVSWIVLRRNWKHVK
jgi:hypothetical protein